MPIPIQKALRSEPLVIHGDGGRPAILFCIQDIARALAFLAEHPEVQGVFNAGYSGSLSIGRLATQVNSTDRVTLENHPYPARPGDIRHSSASVAELRSVRLGAARFDLESGLEMTLKSLGAAI